MENENNGKSVEKMAEELIDKVIAQMENLHAGRRRAHIRPEFERRMRLYSTERVAVEHIEPQGKFMNVFMVRHVERDDFVSPFACAALAALEDALNTELCYHGWTLVQAMITRESGALRIRVRIEKNEIKQNNERQ